MEQGLSRLFRRLGELTSRLAWLVVAMWIVALGALNIGLPQLESVIADNSAAFIPESNEAAAALSRMAEDFGDPDSSAVGYFVLADPGGFDEADRAYYDRLTAGLMDMPEHVAYLLDTQGTAEGREFTTSDDGAAVTLMTVLNGDNGTTEATMATESVRALAHEELTAPDGLEVAFSGPVATTSDQLEAVETSMLVITGVSVVLIGATLLIAYRRLAVVAVALSILGVSLGMARPIVGILGAAGVLEMSMFTAALMTALVIGAGTDYAVFVIGRFQESRRAGATVSEAAADSVGRIATVIIASGLTVAAACLSMLFTKVGIFRTAGPPIAVGILVSLAVALTLGPALLTIFGRTGRADAPVKTAGTGRGPTRSERRWRRRAAAVVRRPAPALLLTLAVLAPFIALGVAGDTNYDEFSAQPADSESNRGYALADEHFPRNELLAQYVIVRSDHDMRNTDDLAALERVAASLEQVPGVTAVRSITRPGGDPLDESALGFQAGVIADALADGQAQIDRSRDDLDRLVAGARALDDGATELDSGAGELAAGAGELGDGLDEVRGRLPELVDGTAQLTSMTRQVLGAVETAEDVLTAVTGRDDGVQTAVAGIAEAADGLRAASAGLADSGRAAAAAADGLEAAYAPLRDPAACPDPACAASAELFTRLDTLIGGQLSTAVENAITAGHGAGRVETDLAALGAGLDRLAGAIDTATADLAAQGGPAAVRAELDRLDAGVAELQDGVDRLADGGAELRAGTGALTDGTARLRAGTGELREGTVLIPPMIGELTGGLGEATAHLFGMRDHADAGPGAGFYLPEFAFDEPRFVAAADFFVSPDGRTARMMVIADGDPLSVEALADTDVYRDRAGAATDGTALDGAEITVTGFAAVYHDLSSEIDADFLLVAIICLAAITIILALLLRSVVAPLLIAVTSVVSYLAAVGIGVLVWQYVAGIPLHWSVMPLSFVLLVGVGADYSVLAITRIREESAHTVTGARAADGGLRLGVIRGLGSTGGLITTAGVVFAVTMFALMAGGLYLLAQLGFVVGIGLLLDILIVRAALVPAALVLLGRRSWWPARD